MRSARLHFDWWVSRTGFRNAISLVCQRFRNGNDVLRFQPLRLGCWRRETERFRRRGTRGPQEVAERPSQAPNGKRQATASPSSRNEHARSRASSTGVGVRGDAARSACWFRRIYGRRIVTGIPVRMHSLSADQSEASGRARGGGEPARAFWLVGAHRGRDTRTTERLVKPFWCRGGGFDHRR